jgi:hypothetical protein
MCIHVIQAPCAVLCCAVQVIASLKRSGLLDKIGKEMVHVNVHDAVLHCSLLIEEEDKDKVQDGV